MRRAYILAYDIADKRRLRLMHTLAKGFGVPLQFSIFSCTLNRADRVRLASRIDEVIDLREDRVIIIDIGPVPDIESWIPPIEVFGSQEIPKRAAMII